MPWATIASVAAPIIGGLFSSNSADNAADAQRQGSDAAIAETRRQYEQSRADLSPYRQAGSAALSRLRQMLGIEDTSTSADAANSPLLRKFAASDLESDPVYQSGLNFGLNTGTEAINRRALAGGGYDSGATLKALTRFGNDYGSTKAGDSRSRFVDDQNNQYGRLSGVVGTGTGATNTGVNAGSNSASNLSSLYSGLGNARGAAAIAGGNAIGGAFTSAANNYQQNQLLQKLTGGGQRQVSQTPATAGDYGGV